MFAGSGLFTISLLNLHSDLQVDSEADAKVAEISANAAEYQGQKDAAIALQRLASINGWTVKTEKIDDTHTKYSYLVSV